MRESKLRRTTLDREIKTTLSPEREGEDESTGTLIDLFPIPIQISAKKIHEEYRWLVWLQFTNY